MDERQKEAAERALHRLEMDELIKRIALKHRTACLNDVSFFGLPFRILFSLKQPKSQIPLSKFYPFRAASAETEEQINEALQRERFGEISDERLNEIRTNIEARDYTPENMKGYYFSCFLSGWDFSHFKNWDWTGNRIPPAEAERLRAYYTERQGMYENHPERFALPALKLNDDIHRYSKRTQELITMFDNLPD